MLESENPSNVLGIEGENHAYLFGKHGYDAGKSRLSSSEKKVA